jgi:hypothetical protein
MDGTRGRIAGKVQEDGFCKFGEGSEFGFVAWIYGLAKKANLAL